MFTNPRPAVKVYKWSRHDDVHKFGTFYGPDIILFYDMLSKWHFKEVDSSGVVRFRCYFLDIVCLGTRNEELW